MDETMSLLEFALKQTPLAGVLMFIAYRFYKDKAASDQLVLGLVEKCTDALNNNTAAMVELRRVVDNLEIEVRHVAAKGETQRLRIASEVRA